jgi:hypothetical protein
MFKIYSALIQLILCSIPHTPSRELLGVVSIETATAICHATFRGTSKPLLHEVLYDTLTAIVVEVLCGLFHGIHTDRVSGVGLGRYLGIVKDKFRQILQVVVKQLLHGLWRGICLLTCPAI